MNWYSKDNAGDHQGLVIDEDTGRSVAVAYDPKDAPLLAAAPAMLDALKNIEANLTGRDNFAERVRSSLDYARAAIANATARCDRCDNHEQKPIAPRVVRNGFADRARNYLCPDCEHVVERAGMMRDGKRQTEERLALVMPVIRAGGLAPLPA